MEHWAKSFFEKITLKHFQNTFGHFWERFWAFLEFWNFFVFEKFRLDTFGDDFGHFCNFENFLIFSKIFGDSTLHGTLGKKKFKKITLRHLQNTFGHFWERFWAILEIWKFFDLFESFRLLDPPWNTGQKVFSKKSPWNIFKTRLDTFGDDFGHFWNFETFLIFLKIFEDSTLHGTLGKKKN